MTQAISSCLLKPVVLECVTESSAEEALKSHRHLFSLFDIPDELVSDNGTAFVSQEPSTSECCDGKAFLKMVNH